MLKTLNGVISSCICNSVNHAIRRMQKQPSRAVQAQQTNYSALDQLLARPRAFVNDFNDATYVNSTTLASVYGVQVNSLLAVISKINLPDDFSKNNIIKKQDGSYSITSLGLLELSKYITGDLSTEVTLAFIRALMIEDDASNTKILNDSKYRREVRDYAANLYQGWISQAEKAGVSIEELNWVDIDKLADGLISESLGRVKLQIGFTQHMEARVSFIPS